MTTVPLGMSGTALDGNGQFNVKIAEPFGYVMNFGFRHPEQSAETAAGLVERAKDLVSNFTYPNS